MKKYNKYFKTNVLLKNIIGKDLINDDNIAILELVKNSYDAGSRLVNIYFKNLKYNDDGNDINSYTNLSSKIIIQDYGFGMDENDIENKWLNIAYSEKKNKREYNGRMLAGAKGVGRFSCDRLGRYLDLYTRANNNNILHLNIDWNKFEIENEQNLEIQSIPVKIEELSDEEFERSTLYDRFNRGTILEISGLREKWTDYDTKKQVWITEKLLKLKKNLEKLLNPNQSFSKDSFTINLFADEFTLEDSAHTENHSKINGRIENVIFDKLNFTSTNISAEVDSKGEIITTTLTDKGRNIFVLKEKNTFTDLKNINIVLYYLNTYSKIYFAKQTGIRSVNFGSVFLFINGFRIPPYGEEGDDWLGLENRKGQGYARNLGTRELIGRIEILDLENKFKIVSSREGLVKDDAYTTLTDSFFYSIFRRLERFVVDGLDWDRLTKKKKKTDDFQEEFESDITAKTIAADFEKLVNQPDWQFEPSNEKYYESQTVKDRRILSLIDNILGVKKENIIELYINEELINSIINAEQRRASELLSDLVEKLNLMPLSQDIINKVFQEADDINSELEHTLRPILESKNLNVDTFAIISEYRNRLLNYKSTINELRTKIDNIQYNYRKLELDLQNSNTQISQIEEARNNLELELVIERQKNTYLLGTRKNLGSEIDIFIHDIKISTYSLLRGINNLMRRSTEADFSPTELLTRLANIKIEGEKNLKLSQLINHSNFSDDAEKQTLDIVEYIKQYVVRYNILYEEQITFDKDQPITFSFVDKQVEFYRKVSVISLSIILDNLISNAEKWGATAIEIDFSTNNEELIIVFSDNGKGLSEKFIKKPNYIFELGVLDIPEKIGAGSSGVGLYTVKKLLNDMNGDIQFLGNNVRLQGASFELTYK